MLTLDSDAVLWSAAPRDRAGRPLLVLLHGMGSNEDDLFALAPYLPLEFVIASVRAPHQEPPGWAWFARGLASQDADITDAVDESTDALLAWLAANRDGFTSIGLMGFSQGGVVAVHALRRDPDAAAYAVNLAGFTIRGDEPADAVLAERRPPVFWGRGALDELVPGTAIARTMAWLPHYSTLTAYSYEGLTHAISAEEIDDVNGFLRAHA